MTTINLDVKHIRMAIVDSMMSGDMNHSEFVDFVRDILSDVDDEDFLRDELISFLSR